MKKIGVLFGILISVAFVQAQDSPKLVVGIVVDQMRPDYLGRYQARFQEDGFNRFLNQGFVAKNMHYDYVPTYTGPGHAAVYTGTTPKYNGIIANDWYRREWGRSIYCAYDSSVNTVGTNTKAGMMSPKILESTTITDELRMFTNFQSKVVGLSIKDRGAIFPAGHKPTGAYWFDKKEGKLITSTYYMESLPNWVSDFNKIDSADMYLDKTWNTLYPIDSYVNSEADDQPYEYRLKGKKDATFPYDLKKYRNINGNYELLATSPFGNSWLTDAALAAIQGEQLGKDEVTDFLAISYSSTDYIGHAFGPHSIEVEDTYLRLDLELARLFKYLDETVGKGEYIAFLTADHGVANTPHYNIKHRMPGGTVDYEAIMQAVKANLKQKYGDGKWVLDADNDQLYLNHQLIDDNQLDREEVAQSVVKTVLQFDEVANAFTASEITKGSINDRIELGLNYGYHPKRSGDVLLLIKNGYMSMREIGTTHGSGYNYDTHVPFMMFGYEIENRVSYRPVSITDISATLAAILGIPFPSACIGEPILEVLE
jgi:predicted AlkP superfamily pyrophosphatase or phosphodiesterase